MQANQEVRGTAKVINVGASGSIRATGSSVVLGLLALLFIGLPILEIVLLIQVGDAIGTWPTIGICVATGLLGAWLSRAQGARTMQAMQARMRRGEMPGREMTDAAMILVAGVMLMTPGVVTDALGLLLLTPFGRALARRALSAAFASRVQTFRPGQGFGGGFGGFDPRRGPFGPGPGGGRPGESGGPRREADRQEQPDVEFLPPGAAPRPPKRERPEIIDVD